MSVASMRKLLEAGVHFGHRSNRWNPKMRPYIFTERNGIHIIDLQQTVGALDRALNVVRNIVADGGTIIFVGTKRQAQSAIIEQASRCGMPFVNLRWLGGTMTNFATIRSRIDYMLRLEDQQASGAWEVLPKKEATLKLRELSKLHRRLGGLRNMTKLPQALFVIDTNLDEIAIKEANRLGIPVIALVDTNCNPDPIDFVIPSNDDAIRAITLITSQVADAVIDGQNLAEQDIEEDVPAAAPDAGLVAEVETEEDVIIIDEDENE